MVTSQGASGAELGYAAATYGSSPRGGFRELDGTENAEQGTGGALGVCNAAAGLGKRRWSRERRGKSKAGAACCLPHGIWDAGGMLHVGGDQARDARLCLVPVALLWGSGTLPAAGLGHSLRLGLKME